MRGIESGGVGNGDATVAEDEDRTDRRGGRQDQGELTVVGLGPGDKEGLTYRAYRALADCDAIVGYTTYLKAVKELFPEKVFHSGGMRREVDRASLAVELAVKGGKVAIVSGGDAGIYGMAGLVCELAPDDLAITIVPGVTAASSVAALLGAPLMHDFVALSLSDLLTPWEEIENKADAAFGADFVVVLYNPRSANRDWQLERIRDIALDYRKPATPVGVGWRDGRKELSTLRAFCDPSIDMSATVIIGNSKTIVKNGRMVTPRGYPLRKK